MKYICMVLLVILIVSCREVSASDDVIKKTLYEQLDISDTITTKPLYLIYLSYVRNDIEIEDVTTPTLLLSNTIHSPIISLWKNGLLIRSENKEWGGYRGGFPYYIETLDSIALKSIRNKLEDSVSRLKLKDKSFGVLWPYDVPWLTIYININNKEYIMESSHPIAEYMGDAYRTGWTPNEYDEFINSWDILESLFEDMNGFKYIRISQEMNSE